MAESHSNLNCVETRSLLGEARDLAQVSEKLTTSNEAHDEENLMFSLEHVVHADEEGMISLHQNVLLQLSGFDLIVFNDDVLAKSLHGIDVVCTAPRDKEDFTKRTATNDGSDFKVAQADVLILIGLGKTRCIVLLWDFFVIVRLLGLSVLR